MVTIQSHAGKATQVYRGFMDPAKFYTGATYWEIFESREVLQAEYVVLGGRTSEHGPRVEYEPCISVLCVVWCA